jgi:thioredoxin 1
MNEITKDNFDETIKSGLVVIDWWAPWCGPCRTFGQTFERVSQKHDDVTFGKVNVDENKELAARFGILSIPNVMIVKDGEILMNEPGKLSERMLDAYVEHAKES